MYTIRAAHISAGAGAMPTERVTELLTCTPTVFSWTVTDEIDETHLSGSGWSHERSFSVGMIPVMVAGLPGARGIRIRWRGR